MARDRDPAVRLGGRFAALWAASTTSALGSGLATIAAPGKRRAPPGQGARRR